MKVGEFFISFGIKGDTKKLDNIDEKLNKAEKSSDKAKNSFVGLRNSVLKFTGSLTLAYNVIDRISMSFAKANQQMINFQRQTGLSFQMMNRYASASASVSASATLEGTAQSLQRVAQNLWDIRMGRGDVSPYQELAFVGGNAFNPAGMSVEEVIENLREAIKGVDDIPATNIITRMGFSPDDLLMLRMTKKELEEVNNLFLDSQSREALYQYGLQMRKLDLQITKLRDTVFLGILPAFIEIKTQVKDSINLWIDFISKNKDVQFTLKAIGVAIAGWLAFTHPVVASLTALYLILEDLAFWYMGHKSLFGDMFGERGSNKQAQFKEIGKTMLPPLFGSISNFLNRDKDKPSYFSLGKALLGEQISRTFTQYNEINITTTAKPDRETADAIIEYSALANQYGI